MTSGKINKVAIWSFLILGTILAACTTFELTYDWLYRYPIWDRFGETAHKMVTILIYSNFALLTFAGTISCISLFRKGKIWIYITKGIIINLWIWMAVGIYNFIRFQTTLFEICAIFILLSVMVCLFVLWKIIIKPNE